MTRRLNIVIGLVAAVTLALAAGCGGSSQNTKKEERLGSDFQQRMADAPEWVRRGCGAYTGEQSARVCGTGSMSGTRNLSMCRSQARSRGRTDIARQLNLVVKSMIEDFQETTTGGEYFDKQADDQQHVQDVTKQITNVSLPGTREADSWVSSGGDCFSLVVLDVASFGEALKATQQLDRQVRDYVVQNANKAFSELKDETDGQPTEGQR